MEQKNKNDRNELLKTKIKISNTETELVSLSSQTGYSKMMNSGVCYESALR